MPTGSRKRRDLSAPAGASPRAERVPFPAGTDCGPTDGCQDSPTESFISIWQCNGTAGSCQQQKTDCGGFKCGVGLTCRTSCSRHQDCVSGLCELWSTNTCAPTATVCHVDGKAATAGQGTVAAPFKTISACLAPQAAKISVADGTYDEDLHFTSPALLVAKSASTTPGAPPKVYIRPVSQGVRVDANGVKLQAVQIEGHAGASGVSALVAASRAVELISVRLMTAQGAALVLASTNARLEAVRIGYAKIEGIRATSSILNVKNVTIEKSGGMGLRSSGGTLKGQGLKIFDSGSVGLYNTSALDLQDVWVQGNGTVGIWLVTGSTGKAANLLVTNNGNYGITAYDVDVTLSYATVTNNNSANTQIWCASSKATPALKNSILWSGKGQARAGSGCSFEGSDLDESLGGDNYSANPLFVQPIALPGPQNCFEYSCLDYRINSASPCINHGVTLAQSQTSSDKLKPLRHRGTVRASVIDLVEFGANPLASVNIGGPWTTDLGMSSPFAAVPMLFLSPPDSALLALLDEAHRLLEHQPQVLHSIDRDLDRHGKLEKALRQQDAQWREARSLGLPTVGWQPSAMEPDALRLEVGRPRTSAYVVFTFLVGRGYYGGFKSSDATTLLQESTALASTSAWRPELLRDSRHTPIRLRWEGRGACRTAQRTTTQALSVAVSKRRPCQFRI